jgi:hypothetical protein
MTQIKIRWMDLGSPTEPGNYLCGLDMVRVTLGDIELAKGNPDAVFTAIHPDFYPDGTPYLLTHIEFPGQVMEIPERDAGSRDLAAGEGGAGQAERGHARS